jgi:hypothetical protein
MSEKLRLQKELAYSCARSDIESYCQVIKSESVTWFDLTSAGDDDREFVLQALRYLELCGLIERHEIGSLVAILPLPQDIETATQPKEKNEKTSR